MRFAARLVIVVLLLPVLVSLASPTTYAQTPKPTITFNVTTHNDYNSINANPDVPVNQHTRVQAVIIDLLSATSCVLTGIDPVDKNKACLGVDPKTGKFGYSLPPQDENGQRHYGGLLGLSNSMVAVLYTPTVSTKDYIHYMARNFGIVKSVYAQTDTGYGFNGLAPVLALWTAIRNMAYFLLMVAFIIIGLGIMLRVKVDPRTVMTLQNQIPRIIICILLVTFSYAIAGVLIDVMWLTTYVGINMITSAGGTGANSPTNPTIPGNGALIDADPNKADGPLSQKATANLLQTPLTYFNEVFRTYDSPGSTNVDSGIGHIADEVSYSLGRIIQSLIDESGIISGLCGFQWTTILTTVLSAGTNLIVCGILSIVGYIATFFFWIVIIVIVIRTLFSVWLTLLKAYTYVIIYTIGAPFFIVMGLLPGKTLGFEKWIRSMAANLAVFPITAFMFVLGRLFIDLFSVPADNAVTGPAFIPPLVGQPNIPGFLGVLIAFGLLLMTPTVLVQLQEALKVPGNKYGGAAIGGLIAAGAGSVKALPQQIVKKGWQKRTAYQDSGILRKWAAGTQKAVDNRLVGTPGYPGRFVNFIRKQRNKLDREHGGGGH